MWNALADIGDTELEIQKADVFKIKKQNKEQKARGLRENTDLFAKLPENFVSDILAKVPAIYLHENARLACKSWQVLTSSASFITQNALEAKPVLILQWLDNKKCPFTKRKIMEVEDKGLGYELHDFEPGLCKWDLVRSSCNGLILVTGTKSCEYYYFGIKNLATKSCVTLPPPCPLWCSSCNGGVSLGFDPKISKYKVVHICEEFGLSIYTLGGNTDKWRRVIIPRKKQRPNFSSDFSWGDPVVINGRFLYWNVYSDEYILSMDISLEKLVKICIPYFAGKNYTLVESGGYLSLVRNVSESQIDIWVLQNVPWRWVRKHSMLAKLTNYSISRNSSSSRQIENNFPDLSKLAPIGCARNGEILIFRYMKSGTDSRIYLYDIMDREMKKFKMTMRKIRPLISHKHTLFHWNT